MKIDYLHTMVRVSDIEASKRFYCDLLGLVERRRSENEAGRYTLVFLCPPGQDDGTADLELTWNWDEAVEPAAQRQWGHLAYRVDDVYAACGRLMEAGVVINRPPRDGRMAFVKSPDGVSIELLQAGEAREPAEPWASMPNTGSW
jgi:lactoylglutathione lyase